MDHKHSRCFQSFVGYGPCLMTIYKTYSPNQLILFCSVTQGSERGILNEPNHVILGLLNALRMPRGCLLAFYSVLGTKDLTSCLHPQRGFFKSREERWAIVNPESQCKGQSLSLPPPRRPSLPVATALLAFKESKGLRKQLWMLVRCY